MGNRGAVDVKTISQLMIFLMAIDGMALDTHASLVPIKSIVNMLAKI